MSDVDKHIDECFTKEAAERRRTGGPAFPQNDLSGYGIGPGYPMTGMMLRDYFAGQAVAGWLASFRSDEACKANGVAEFAYEIADAMLQAREERT